MYIDRTSKEGTTQQYKTHLCYTQTHIYIYIANRRIKHSTQTIHKQTITHHKQSITQHKHLHITYKHKTNDIEIAIMSSIQTHIEYTAKARPSQ